MTSLPIVPNNNSSEDQDLPDQTSNPSSYRSTKGFLERKSILEIEYHDPNKSTGQTENLMSPLTQQDKIIELNKPKPVLKPSRMSLFINNDLIGNEEFNNKTPNSNPSPNESKKTTFSFINKLAGLFKSERKTSENDLKSPPSSHSTDRHNESITKNENEKNENTNNNQTSHKSESDDRPDNAENSKRKNSLTPSFRRGSVFPTHSNSGESVGRKSNSNDIEMQKLIQRKSILMRRQSNASKMAEEDFELETVKEINDDHDFFDVDIDHLADDKDRMTLYSQLSQMMKNHKSEKEEEEEWAEFVNKNIDSDDDENEIDRIFRTIDGFSLYENEYNIISIKNEREKHFDLYPEKKNKFEMIKMYSDSYPGLKFRKNLMKVFSFISWLSSKIIKSKIFESLSLSVISLNTIILIMDDPTSEDDFASQFDLVFLVLYTIEMFFKIFAMGFVLNQGAYLRDYWNILDFTIISTALLPYLIGNNGVNLSSLRSLRVLRPLRTISSIKDLKVILMTLFDAGPMILQSIFVNIFFMLVFAIAGVQLFSGILKKRCFTPETGFLSPKDSNDIAIDGILCGYKDCPEGDTCGKIIENPNFGIINFDNIMYSFLLVFQCITLEGWSQIMYYVVSTFSIFLIIYFIVLIWIGTFFLANLTLAVISKQYKESSNDSYHDKNEERGKEKGEITIEDIRNMKLGERAHHKRILRSSGQMNLYGASEEDRVTTNNQKELRWEDLLDLKYIIEEEKKNMEDEENFRKIRDHEVGPAYKRMKRKIRRNKTKLLNAFNNCTGNSLGNLIQERNGKKINILGMKGISLIKPLVLALDNSPPTYPNNNKNDNNLNDMNKTNEVDDLDFLRELETKEVQAPKNLADIGILTLRNKKMEINQRQRRKSTLTNFNNGFPEEETKNTLNSIEKPAEKSILKRKGTFESTEFKNNTKGAIHRNSTFEAAELKNNNKGTSYRNSTFDGKEISNSLKKRRMTASIENVGFRRQETKHATYGMGMGTRGSVMVNDQIRQQFSEQEKNEVSSQESLESSVMNDSDFNLPGFEMYDYDNPIRDKNLATLLEELPVDKLIFQKRSSKHDDMHKKKSMKNLILNANLLEKNFIAHAFNNNSEEAEIIPEDIGENKKEQEENSKDGGEDNLKEEGEEMRKEKKKKKKTISFSNFAERRKRLKKIKKKEKEYHKKKIKYNVLHYKLMINQKNKFESASTFEVLKTKLEIEKIKEELKMESLFSQKEYTINYTNAEVDSKKMKKELKKREAELLKEFEAKHLQSVDFRVVNNIRLLKKILKIPLSLPKKDEMRKIRLPLVIRSDLISILEKQRNALFASRKVRIAGSFSSKTSGDEKNASKSFNVQNGGVKKIKKKKKIMMSEIAEECRKAINEQMYTKEEKVEKLKYFKNETDFKEIKKADFKAGVKSDIIKVVVKTKEQKRKEFLEKIKLEKQRIQDQLKLVGKKKLNRQAKKLLESIPPPKDEDDHRTFLIKWSGEDVVDFRAKKLKKSVMYIEFKLAAKINRIFNALSTRSYDKIVWLPGVKGKLLIAHKYLCRLIETSLFENSMLLAVVFNTTILAMDGLFYDNDTLELFKTFNLSLTIIFAIEMGMKIVAYNPKGYAEDRMNLFDGGVVVISLVELFFLSGTNALSAFRTVRIFRTFRVLRVTRLLRSLAFMKIIIEAISIKLKTFIYIGLLLILFIAIYSLIGVQIFAGRIPPNTPDRTGIRQNFDDFLGAFIVVFQLLTVENWNDILTITFISDVGAALTSLYLISWIFLGNYVFLNLIMATMLDGFQLVNEKNNDQKNDLEDEQKEALAKKKEEEEKKKLRLISQMDEEELGEKLLNSSSKKHKKGKTFFEGVNCQNSLFIFSKSSWFRKHCYQIVHSDRFENFILFLIVASSLKLAIDTYLSDEEVNSAINNNIDITFNALFIGECFLKIVSFGFFIDHGSYLRDSWNILDFFIVSSSLIDMSLENIDLPVIRILRLLRTLRPLRFISHNVNMKIVVKALLDSVGGIINVSIVVLLVFLMFSILGMSLLGDRMGYCSVKNPYGISRESCLNELKERWLLRNTNFDNIFNAMTTIFILSTGEGWPNIMYYAIDSDMPEAGPTLDGYKMITFYFVFALTVCNILLINLFVGVLFLKFNDASNEENPYRFVLLTQEQQRWLDFHKMIIKSKSDFASYSLPTNKFQICFYKIISNKFFDSFIMVCIILNILTMALTFEGSTAQYDSILSNINYFFTAVFILEFLLKLVGLGRKAYWYSAWNRFDFFVVMASIIDILMDSLGQSFISFLRVGPQLARIIRVLRVTRLLKLVKSLRGLQKLLEALIVSLPSLINVGTLLLLVFFIYSVLGVFLFKSVTKGDVIDEYNNFSDFNSAMVLLFRCATGENWWVVMYDLFKTENCTQGVDCGNLFSPLYFITFIVICSFIMLNLFILIIVDEYEKYSDKGESPKQVFEERVENFKKTWSALTRDTTGIKMHSNNLIDFFKLLQTPIDIPRQVVAKSIMEMNLSGDDENFVYFNDVLFVALKRGYGTKVLEKTDPRNVELIIKEEAATRLKIEKIKNDLIIKDQAKSRRSTSLSRFSSSFKSQTGNFHFNSNVKDNESPSNQSFEDKKPKKHKKNAINPIYRMLFVGMVFKAWKVYNFRVANGYLKKDESFISEDSEDSEEGDLINQNNSDKSRSDDEFDEEEEIKFQQNRQKKNRKVAEFFSNNQGGEDEEQDENEENQNSNKKADREAPDNGLMAEEIHEKDEERSRLVPPSALIGLDKLNDRKESQISPATAPKKRFSILSPFSGIFGSKRNSEAPNKMERFSVIKNFEQIRKDMNIKEQEKDSDSNSKSSGSEEEY